MRHRSAIKICLLFVVGISVLSFSSCSARIGVGPEVSERRGPPPHAPAHGYRRKCRYYYYPSSEVYFELSQRRYFWIEGGTWRVGVRLPDYIVVSSADRVVVELDGDVPYREHVRVVKEHPGKGKWKEKKHKHKKHQ